MDCINLLEGKVLVSGWRGGIWVASGSVMAVMVDEQHFCTKIKFIGGSITKLQEVKVEGIFMPLNPFQLTSWPPPSS